MDQDGPAPTVPKDLALVASLTLAQELVQGHTHILALD